MNCSLFKPIHTSSTEQCQGEPINDQTPVTVLDDILDLQDESNLNKNSSSFNIPVSMLKQQFLPTLSALYIQ